MTLRLSILAFFCSMYGGMAASVPEWIWHDNKGKSPAEQEVRFFRKTFEIEKPLVKAVLTATADDQMAAFVNGKQVGANENWNKAVSVDITKELKQGQNVIAARAKNNASEAGFIAKVELTFQDNRRSTVVTDTSWLSSEKEVTGWQTAEADSNAWSKPISKGKHGVRPWGEVLSPPVATAADQLTTIPGFKVELLHSASRDEGSWICMAVDPKGRLIIAPQDDKDKKPLLRVTLRDGKIEKWEKIEMPVWTAMGLLYAFDSLYVSSNGKDGLGLYRLRDTDNDDKYDSVEFLKKLNGAAGEHGSHALVLGPDKKIYYIHGNFVKVPADISPRSQHRNYEEDQLLPRQEDGNGFGVGIKPPGSFVLRMDKDAKECELYAAGMRNAYDFDFNADGELFTFDSDMEWDWGTPWYRPVKVFHIVSGGDYGFREGTGKYPNYYPDALPEVVDVGIGSPTGVKFGTKAKFPEKYRKALYIMDWSYGRILAVHLTPQGASYTGSLENFIVGKPLNVTDMEFGKDGALYFTTGGRGTQSGLYRVSYEGGKLAKSSTDDPKPDKNAPEARALRKKLEKYHGKVDPKAVAAAWEHLDSEDRFVRYAARLAIESQPPMYWRQKAVVEPTTRGSLSALLALARYGSSAEQYQLLQRLGHIWKRPLTDEQKLEALRIYSLAFIRMGKPDSGLARSLAQELDAEYPSKNAALNRELCQLLIYLDSPGVVQKTMGLLAKAKTQEEQLYYIFRLRTVKNGWTPEDRQAWFSWFERDRSKDTHPKETIEWFRAAGRDYGDGASFPKFMGNIRKDAIATLTREEKLALGSLADPQIAVAKKTVQRSTVKEWTMGDIVPALDQLTKGRNYAKGKEAFAATQCLACHRFGNEGGSVGPDITGAASRFNARDLLETIIEPSKVVSDQYQNITVTKKDGDDVTGRLVEENNERVVLVVNPLTGDKIEVKKRDIAKREASKVSPMPEGLVNTLSKEEILDLLAYIQSGGKRDHAAFSSAAAK